MWSACALAWPTPPPLPCAAAGVAVGLLHLPGAADGQRILAGNRLAAAALAAPDCRHRLDWLVVLLCLAGQQPAPARPTRPCAKRRGRRAVGGARRRVYNPQKYLVAPSNCPTNCIGSSGNRIPTWLSGFALISVLYYAQADSYMRSTRPRRRCRPCQAVALGLATLAGGWLVYDGLCRLLMRRSILLFAALYFCLCGGGGLGADALAVWPGGVYPCRRHASHHHERQCFSGSSRPEKPWPPCARATRPTIHGQRAKQRSVHNNYLTCRCCSA